MQSNDIIETVRQELAAHREIAFAYVHGSALSLTRPPDVDIAVYLKDDVYSDLASQSRVTMDFTIPLEEALESTLGMKVDIQTINIAPLTFRARVANTGVVIVDRTPNLRADFEYRSRYEYFDFRRRRQEYLAEVMA